MASGAKHREPNTVLAGIGGSLLLSWLVSPALVLVAALSSTSDISRVYAATAVFTGVLAPLFASMIGRRIESQLMHVIAMFQLGLSIGLAAVIAALRAA